MAANRWDHSNILLSNQAGSIMGAGIADVGRNFGRGIERYYERKRQTEKEEATVEWLNQNEAAVNQLFPQLAQVKDPAERKKVIKAGIKGAGLENLVQVQSYMEQQRRQVEMDKINAEMIRANTAAVRTNTANAEALMRERETEARALRAAASDGAGVADQIMRGRSFSQLEPDAEPDRTGIYLRAGGGNPAVMQALAKSKPFRPEEFMTPSGLNMVQTSPNSFVPDPRQRNQGKAAKRPGAAAGPELSRDGSFYRNGPDDPWRPYKKAETEVSPVERAELESLPGEIAALEREIKDQAREVAGGDKRTWYGGKRQNIITDKQAELEEKKKRLQDLRARTKQGAPADDAPADDPTAGYTGDPFAFVLGG